MISSVAIAWVTVLLLVCAVATVKLRSTAARILALDILTLVMVCLLVIYSVAEDVSYYMDASLILALLAFISTLVATRYYAGRRGL
ncbi:monovalent cation/H+ antiporter complex subunit F [Rubrobacter indicoceani]|uniref:monovalent cation/H+ antiporter complex subunit F n=1 Tax=Rubrobacter indicoceani TaxID=2051957 RepID=UPI001F094248|nr:monovalent cation/H+ antiporter complex subunit F [Rubrobacter indicoceani]